MPDSIQSAPTPVSSSATLPSADAQAAANLFDTPPTNASIYDPSGQMTNIPGPSGSNAIQPVSEEQQNQNRSNSVSDHLKFVVPGVIAGAIDTVGQSVGLLGPNDMQNFLNQANNTSGFGDYYANNKSGLKLAGDLATFLIPGTVGAKAVQSGSWLYRALQAERIPAIQKLFTSAADVGDLTSSVYAYDLTKAGKGAVDFISADPVRANLVSQVYKSGISDAIKRYIGSETAIYLTMNKSDNFYPSDMSLTDTILMHSIGAGISTGIEAAFIRSSLKRSLWTDAVKQQVEKNLNPLDLPLSVDSPGERDFSATINSVTAAEHRATRLTSTDPDVIRYSTKLETISNIELKNDISKIYQDGIPEIITPNRKNSGGIQTILTASQIDPTIPKGISALTDMPAKVDELAALQDKGKSLAIKYNAKADKLLAEDPVANADAAAELQRNADRLSSYETRVIEPTGEVHDPQNIKTQYQYLSNPPEIARIPQSTLEDGKFTLDITNPNTNQRSVLALSDKLLPYYPTGKSWTDLDRFEQSGMYALGQKWIDKYQPGKNILDKSGFTNRIQITNQTEPFILDTMRSLIAKKPTALADFQLPAGVTDTNFDKWAEWQSLQNKYSQFTKQMDNFTVQGDNTILLPASLKQNLDDIRYSLNFPSSRFGQQHPAFRVFQNLYMQGDRNLSDAVANLGDFQGMMKTELLKLPATVGGDLGPSVIDTLRAKPISTLGNNLAYPMDQNGNFLKAQLAFIKPAKWDLTKTSMDMYAASKKMEFLNKFNSAPPLIQGFAQKILGTGAYNTLQRGVTTLAEGQQFGHGIVGYQNMATRGLDTFTAADMVSNNVENNARMTVRDLFKQQDSAFLNLQKNSGDMFQFAQFTQARRYGFELEPDVSPNPATGAARFTLKADADTGELTARNQTAWKRAFGPDAELPNGVAYLPDIIASKKTIEAGGSHIPLELGQGAFSGVQAIKAISDQLWETGNFFRQLYGRAPLGYQEWHVPPQNLRNEFIKYIVQPAEAGGGQPVKTLITGKTAAELEAKVATPAIQDMLKKPGAFLVDQNDMRRYFDLHDEAFFNMLDFSDGLAQTGKNTGSAVSPLLEYGNQVLNDMISGVEKQVISYGRRTTASIFQDEINYARMADKASDVATSQAKGGKVESIWQMYTNRLLGVTVPASENIINAEVPLIDNALAKAQQAFSNIWKGKKVVDAEGNLIGSKGSVQDYEQLKKVLGPALPFSDAADFAANTFKTKTPWELQKISGTLNAMAGTTVLRLLEVGNAVISLVGNLVSMPLVMNNLKRMPYDTDASWAARTGFMGTPISPNTALPNPVRMMSKSISFLFTKEGQDMLTDAYKVYGNLKPQMAENFKVMHAPFQTPFKRWMSKATDFLSTPSDKGEEWSRVWAYSAGYQMGKLNGLSNKTDLHNMANLFADNVIANYRPSNKPQVFQGAIGGPLGLFQTYMWNYYGRMFQYIENKNYRALAINYALQSGVFGLESVPGWQQYQQLHAMAYSGEHDLVDNLDKMYGNRMSDLILHGSISNIPRLFSRDGIALYSRGDVNLTKVPAFIDPSNAPLYSIATNTIELVGALLNQYRTGGAPSMQQTLETLGTYSINRPLGRLFELAAGVSADRAGNLINEDTRQTMSVVSRMMSLRPAVEQKNIETNARIANTQSWQEAVHDRADQSLRSIFRDNTITPEAINNKLSHIIMDYVGHGGNPNNVGELIRNAAIAANVTKQDRKLLEVMNNPSRLNDVLRIINNINDYQGDK